MEFAVGRVAFREIRGVIAHPVDRLAHGHEVSFLGVLRGHRRNFTFDQMARSEEIKRARTLVGIDRKVSGTRRGHENSRTHAHFDPTADLQRNDRFAHRGPGYAKQGRKLALGRQARARRKFAIVDQRRDLAGDLPVEAQRFDRMQWHGSASPDAGGGQHPHRVSGPRDWPTDSTLDGYRWSSGPTT